MTAEQSLAGRLDRLTRETAANYPESDTSCIDSAYDCLKSFAAENQQSSVLSDALSAADLLVEMRLDPEAIAATLLVSRVLQAGPEWRSQESEIGQATSDLLQGVERLEAIHWHQLEREAAETVRKAFLAMAQDVRVVLIVLAHKTCQLRALEQREPNYDERVRIAQEALGVFAPLANRLGLWQMKWELEDAALRQLEPKVFAELTQLLAETRSDREAFIQTVVARLQIELESSQIKAQVKGRPKHLHSIYKKMQRKQLNFDQLYDISAVRVITSSVKDCYASLGAVHSLWTPIQGEFDDYIALPKSNGYQSLHTAVMGPEGRPVEVQIRTEEMHRFAEYGVAAHWAYKEQTSATGLTEDRFLVLRQLLNWESDSEDPEQLVESLKTDVFEDQVYVFTPQGDIIDLPKGATPLDFAYRVHTQVGHRCRGARVNEQIAPLDYALRTGERVEILTQKEPNPSRDWMNPTFGFLQTASARAKVRHWFREQGKEQAIQQGHQLIQRELARLDLKHITLSALAARLAYENPEDLSLAVGYGDRSSESVAGAALQLEREAHPEEEQIPPSVPPSRKPGASGVSFHDVDQVLGARGKCCNPVPGDDVVGFITRGRGLIIHRRQCSQIKTNEPERIVEVRWGPKEGELHRVEVEVQATDRHGLLSELTRLIAAQGVSVVSARADAAIDGNARLRLQMEFRSAEQLAHVLERLDRDRSVLEVRRVGR